MKKPDVVIQNGSGEPYLLRWFLLPRNKFLNVYLHKFVSSDGENLHDHPWCSVSIALKGKVTEEFRAKGETCFREIAAGGVVFRSATFAHRFTVDQPFWTVFITGPTIRDWGFFCGDRFVPWQQFTGETKYEPGVGCGEHVEGAKL